jgi:transposase-like protein
MPRCIEETKEQVVRKMMPPHAQSVAQVHRETGISEPTLHAWRNRYRAEGQVVPEGPSNPENGRGENKLALAIETAALNKPYNRDRKDIRHETSKTQIIP